MFTEVIPVLLKLCPEAAGLAYGDVWAIYTWYDVYDAWELAFVQLALQVDKLVPEFL